MKQMFFAAVTLMFLFSGNLRAQDSFALLRKQYQDVSDEWKNYISTGRRKLARKSLDPQVRRDLRFHQDLVEDLIRTSREVHRVLEKLKLGDDVPLVRHAENLRSSILLYERTAQNGYGGEKSKDAPDLVFRVMEADLEGLEEIGFSCKNGAGTVSPEASAWPEFFRFKRQIRMLKLYLEAREKAVQMNMSLQKKNEILREIPDVTASADRLSARIQQDFPDLKQEGVLLSALSRKLLEDANVQTPTAGLKKTAMTAKEKPSKPEQCLLQIAKILGKIEKRIRESVREKEKMSEKPPREKPKAEPVRTPPAAPPPVRPKTGNVPERKREVPLERRSEEELNGELAGLRKRILPDAEKDVLTADELERCLDLLSEKERKQYETIRLRQIRNGSGQYEAPLEALKELKELLTAPDAAFPSKQETIRILKKAQAAETGK